MISARHTNDRQTEFQKSDPSLKWLIRHGLWDIEHEGSWIAILYRCRLRFFSSVKPWPIFKEFKRLATSADYCSSVRLSDKTAGYASIATRSTFLYLFWWALDARGPDHLPVRGLLDAGRDGAGRVDGAALLQEQLLSRKKVLFLLRNYLYSTRTAFLRAPAAQSNLSSSHSLGLSARRTEINTYINQCMLLYVIKYFVKAPSLTWWNYFTSISLEACCFLPMPDIGRAITSV